MKPELNILSRIKLAPNILNRFNPQIQNNFKLQIQNNFKPTNKITSKINIRKIPNKVKNVPSLKYQ